MSSITIDSALALDNLLLREQIQACRIAHARVEREYRERMAAVAGLLDQIVVLAEFGTTGPADMPPCRADGMSAPAATALRGAISRLGREAFATMRRRG